MAISVFTGPLGSGKSATLAAMGFEHLRRGGVVACNFKLKPDWALQAARKTFAGMLSEKMAQTIASDYQKRWFYVDSVHAIMSIDVSAFTVGRMRYKSNSYQEGLGLLLLDEAGMCFNSRDWSKNRPWINFLGQSRKKLWDVCLACHDIEELDKQIRSKCLYTTTSVNFQSIRIPLIGLPLSPIPCFGMKTVLTVRPTIVIQKKIQPLPYWVAKLYDSREEFSPDQWTDTISEPQLMPCELPVSVPDVPRSSMPELQSFLADCASLPVTKFHLSPKRVSGFRFSVLKSLQSKLVISVGRLADLPCVKRSFRFAHGTAKR